jgi:hypothetical protein
MKKLKTGGFRLTRDEWQAMAHREQDIAMQLMLLVKMSLDSLTGAEPEESTGSSLKDVEFARIRACFRAESRYSREVHDTAQAWELMCLQDTLTEWADRLIRASEDHRRYAKELKPGRPSTKPPKVFNALQAMVMGAKPYPVPKAKPGPRKRVDIPDEDLARRVEELKSSGRIRSDVDAIRLIAADYLRSKSKRPIGTRLNEVVGNLQRRLSDYRGSKRKRS